MLIDEILLRNSAQKQLKEFVRNRLNGQCIYCGDEFDFLTCDHIVPKTKGGSTSHHNLSPACITCNSRKGSKDVWEWWQKSGHWKDAVEKGRDQLLREIIADRRSLADFLTDTLGNNPQFRIKFEKTG